MFHLIALSLLSLPCIMWWSLLADWLIRGRRLPALSKQSGEDLPGSAWPSLTVLIPARNEEGAVERSVRSLATQDYPNLQILVVNDRSTDRTGAILQQLADEFSNVSVHTIKELPAGWLGKTHAIWTGTKLAGERDWFLFTDADVVYAPHTLRRAVRYGEMNAIDLLSLYPDLDLRGFWERAIIAYFVGLSFFRFGPWRVNNPRSGVYIAVGAFNLVRRSVYERVGTYQSLAMEVVDDVEFGGLVKRAGANLKIIIGLNSVRVRWQEGVRGIMRGLTKNSFAGLGYSLIRTMMALAGQFVLSIVPFLGLLMLPSLAGWIALATLAGILGAYWMSSHGTGIHFLHVIGHPVAAIIFMLILIRSAFHTIRDGGVNWRGTHYSTDELRRGKTRSVSAGPSEGA